MARDTGTGRRHGSARRSDKLRPLKPAVYKQMRRLGEPGVARFLTFSCYKRLPLLNSVPWRDEFTSSLAAAKQRCTFKLVAWVVMPEHVHLLMADWDDDWPISRCLTAIKKPIAQRAIARWRAADASILRRIAVKTGHRYWQAGGGFDRLIRTHTELWETIEYCHQNPVKRGLVSTSTDWAWSSARWYAGERAGQISIDEATR